MNLVDKIVGMLGIAKRGKYTVVGDDIIFKIKKNKIQVIITPINKPKI